MISIITLAQSPFEGILKMDLVNPSNNEKSSITWWVKNGQHLMEVNSLTNNVNANYTLIMDKSSSNIKMLAEANGQKMLYNIPGDQIKSKLAVGDNAAVTKSKDTKTIAGKSCKKVILKDSKGKTIAWITNGLHIDSKNLPDAFKNGSVLSALEKNGITGYPLEIVATDLAGNLVYSQVFKSISPQAISDDTFTLPTNVNSLEQNMSIQAK